MQEAALLHMLDLQHHIAVPAAARRRNYVLVEGKGYKHNNSKQVNRSAHGAHGLGDLLAVVLAHVDALESGLDEGRSEPADEGKRGAKRKPTEGERYYERLVIALEGIGEDGDAGDGERKEAERLGARQRRRAHGWALVLRRIMARRW
jgi:hypothetical protein